MILDRRRLLAAAVSLPAASLAAPAVVRAQTLADVDVLIVGAGAAGIAAARELQKMRKSFLLVEARNRVGGRVFTDRTLGAHFDAGAVYIHWAEDNPWAQFSRDLGVATSQDTGTPGAFRFFESGTEVAPSARQRRRAAFARLGPLMDGDGVPDISIAALADMASDDRAEMRDAAAGLARMALGDEPARISALDYGRLWSGGDLLVPSGYGDLVARAAADVPVRLSTRVDSIDWSGAGIVAQTSAGTINARAAIVTVPVGVLQAGGIRFTPALAVATQDAIGGMGMGALSKIGLTFDFTKLDVPSGDIFASEGPGRVFDFEVRPFGRDIAVAIFGGDFAREITRDPDVAKNIALDYFVHAVGSSARAAFQGAAVHAWHNDALSLGCYSHCLPGHAGARAALAEPVGGRLFFAGEASAPAGGAMTAGGAWLAGIAAARRAGA